MKKIIRIVVFALLVCLLIPVTACKRDEYVVPVLPEDYEVDPSGRIKVSTYLRSGKDSEIALDNWIKEYNDKYPKVKIRKEIISWGDFPVQVASGDIGDVYYSSDVDVYKYAIQYKAAMPLDAYVENLNIDITALYTSVYDLGCYNGLLYMVPSDISQTVYYTNTTLLEQEGLSLPPMDWTWDDLLEYCSRIRKENEDGTYSQTAIYIEGAQTCYFMPFFSGWGGKWVDSVNKKVNFVSDEKVLKGVGQIFELIDKGYASADNLRGEIATKYKGLQYPQNYAFYPVILWQSRVTLWNMHEELGLKMDVSPVPKTPVLAVSGDVFGYIAYSKTKNPDAAATFSLFLLSQEGQVAFNNRVGGGIPCTKEGIESGIWRIPYEESEFRYDAFTVYPEAFIASWAECYVPPEIAEIINKYIATIIPEHYTNTRSYDNTLKALEQQCNETWAELYNEG